MIIYCKSNFKPTHPSDFKADLNSVEESSSKAFSLDWVSQDKDIGVPFSFCYFCKEDAINILRRKDLNIFDIYLIVFGCFLYYI